MARMRKIPKEIGLDRVFRPGRLRRQWLAAAYERLVPIRCVAVDHRPCGQVPEVREEYQWAR